jgi:hypothetical protein
MDDLRDELMQIADSGETEVAETEVIENDFQDDVAPVEKVEEVKEAPPFELPPSLKMLPNDIKELLPTLDKRVVDYLNNREMQIHKEFTDNKGNYAYGKQVNDIFAPYKEYMQQSNINPIALVKGYAETEYALATGTNQQKIAILQNIIKGYNIDVNEEQEYIDPAYQTLTTQQQNVLREQEQVKKQLEERTSEEYLQNVYKSVIAKEQDNKNWEEFTSNPSNKYASNKAVLAEMSSLYEQKAASNYQDLYNLACKNLEFPSHNGLQEKNSQEIQRKLRASSSISNSKNITPDKTDEPITNEKDLKKYLLELAG